MASVDDVARQVSAAIDKASEARDALARADDLAEEAHDELAATLRGARSDLASEGEQMLATFTDARDGMRDLFGILDRGREAAERYLSTLTGDATPQPGPDAPRPAQPPTQPLPTRRAEPDDPPAIPPERIEQLRRELPPPVVAGTGQKTRGYWIGADGTTQPVVSGRDGDADEADARLRDMGMPRKSAKTGDVEIKLATRMVREGIRHATVLINNEPCVGPFGCDTLVPILLPEGSSLTVYGTTEQGERIRKRYTGGARPWWR